MFEPVMNEAIKRNSGIISQLFCDGDIAMVIYKPSSKKCARARMYGCDGESSTFRMSAKMHMAGIHASRNDGDVVRERRLGARATPAYWSLRTARVFLNFTAEDGFWGEPGQDNEELLS